MRGKCAAGGSAPGGRWCADAGGSDSGGVGKAFPPALGERSRGNGK